MKRRNVLLGLGTAAAGSGMVFGSGAFTQVSAERTISIEVDDDNNSSVGIESGAAPQGGFADISETSNGAIEFNLGSETFNTDATVTVGESVSSSSLDSSPAAEQVAFVIRDDSNFTDDTDDALGVEFSIPSSSKIAQIQFDFIGDGDDGDLSKTAADNSSSGGTDFSSVSSTAETGDDPTDDLTAKFVLNSNSPDSSTNADNYSGVAAGVITLDTTGASGSTSINLDATITAEVVSMTQ
jgi:hypothetical protein